MYISTVLVSSNLNPDYYKNFPIINKLFYKNGVRCFLILVTYDNFVPNELKDFIDDIIIYNVDKQMGDSYPVYIAQNIRLLYPAIMCVEGAIMISDVDMHVLDMSYFQEKVENLSDDYFVNLGLLPDRLPANEYYMCYNIATNKTWGDIFKINSLADIKIRLESWWKNLDYHVDTHYRSKCRGFHHDQSQLYSYLLSYTNKLIINKDFQRIEGRYTIGVYREMLKSNKYIDLIPLKPFTKYLNFYKIIYSL
jgi:hypothetical protein